MRPYTEHFHIQKDTRVQKTEMIFNSVWTALMGIIILTGHSHPYKEWTTPLGVILLLPSAITVVALVVTAGWFQSLFKKLRTTESNLG